MSSEAGRRALSPATCITPQ